MPDHEYTVTYEIPNSGGSTLQVVFIDACIIAPDEIEEVIYFYMN